MGVRVDREGQLMRDYQTATGVLVAATAKPDMGRTVVSPRFYLSDAGFLVGLESDELALLRQLNTALRAPRWPLALGRKAFVPSAPVWLSDKHPKDGPFGGLHPGQLETALREQPRIAEARFIAKGQPQPPVRVVVEHVNAGALRHDQPMAPFAERRFGPRFVQSGVLDHVPEPAEA
jgi:CRISPR system Cascade subunit CasD